VTPLRSAWDTDRMRMLVRRAVLAGPAALRIHAGHPIVCLQRQTGTAEVLMTCGCGQRLCIDQGLIEDHK
jgi:hypothetical protein